MQVLKSLGGPGRSVEFGKMYQWEGGDLFVVYYPYSLQYEFENYFISSEHYAIKDVLEFLSDMVENHFVFYIYVYGDFDDNDIEIFKKWLSQYTDVINLTVTHKLPNNAHSSSDGGYGPFVVEEV